MTEQSSSTGARFWEHVERPEGVPLGVKRVEWRGMASNKEAPDGWKRVVVYRPLNADTFVYRKGMEDFRPLDEFLRRYRPIKDPALIAKLTALSDEIYDPGTWARNRSRMSGKE